MSSFKHFSHSHPLIFIKEKNIEEEINRDQFCNICSLPILLSSFYSCSVTGCKYFLHEPCALLPRRIDNPWRFGDFIPLGEHEETCYCARCDQECKNLHYCNRRRPDYATYDPIHPMCGAPMEIKSKHKSHPLHPLVAVCRETLARCDLCGKKQNGYFFSCHPCNFWIHVDCALLPRFVECTKHMHPLILCYSIIETYYYYCMICNKKVLESGAYLCVECKRYAHLRCVADNMKDLGTEAKVEVIDLPFDDHDALWSWTIQNLQKLKVVQGNSTNVHNLHGHGLILYNDDDHGINTKSSSGELVCCDVCIQPIYPPFYACPRSQSDACRFHLHQQCSEIPFRVKDPVFHNNAQELHKRSTQKSLCSLFRCSACCLPSNGLSYYYGHGSYITDIACLSAPKFIKHDSHRKHFLYPLHYEFWISRRILACCSVPLDSIGYAYACVDCDFTIHVHCALLPKWVKHKFDVHPLMLITTGIIKDTTNSSDYFCEFCEEDIDTRFWYYGCEECNNLFHIKCIPSVGYLSKVKFGHSITVSCHPHRVTSVRMLGYGSQKCGYCKKIILGFVDDMAFHCSECDFWLHFECVEKCTGATRFKMGDSTQFGRDHHTKFEMDYTGFSHF